MKLSNYIPISFCLLYLCMSVSGFSQKQADSLLTIANKLVYENPDKAIEIASGVLEHKETPVKYKISALLSLSTSYSSKRDYEKSLEYVLLVTDYLSEIKDDKQKMNILNRIGGQYQDLKIYDKAIDYLDEALVLIESYPRQDSIQTYLGYNAILRGFIYREQMSCEIALKYFDKAIEAYQQTLSNPIMNANVSICYYNQGNCLLSLDNMEAAETSYVKSIIHADRIDAPSLIAFAEKGLAEIKTREGKYPEAIIILNGALDKAEHVGDLILNRGLYEGLSNNYLALNDWENYTLFRDKYLTLQKETKISERKSINQSLWNITVERADEIEQLHRWYTPLEILLICLTILSFIFLIRFIIRSERSLKNLENKLKNN
ncbi:tetratricopeptide repeat protein [Altibacter sp.]|uniref:tetratricopeptide repeat protein n=1 Tax=Altibacter sp. TaxID=2024823 RepID=UPI0025846627|nr:tetratricopeptide repeat protein [Altibacter sp.]MCW9037524.1 tetratricopeptide repeat protein [Altibacter sp.]